jgi:hypothetical protein
MSRRNRIIVFLTLVTGLVASLLIWRIPRDDVRDLFSSLVYSPVSPLSPGWSPVDSPIELPSYSPLPVPPTAIPPVTTATLQAIRASRPTATAPSHNRVQLPYIAPSTWRRWALRFLVAAGLAAYIGLRMRKRQ